MSACTCEGTGCFVAWLTWGNTAPVVLTDDDDDDDIETEEALFCCGKIG